MAGEREQDVFRLPGFLPFWWAETISGLGSYVTAIALQVLVVITLNGTSTDVGVLNAFRWLPYLLLGFIVGALVERASRKPVLMGADLGRAVLLAAIPALWLIGWLNLPVLFGFVALFGVLSLLHDAAAQSFVPRLVPRASLVAANARLDQGGAAAQTAGPVLGGALVTALSAPIAVLVDAASYLFSAIALSRIRVSEPPAVAAERPSLWREIEEGLAWVYRHPTLGPLQVSTHAWFVFNAMLGAIFAPFVLLELRLSAFELGVTLAFAGGAALLGSLLAVQLGARFGAGRAVILSRTLMPIAWAMIALVPAAGASQWALIVMLAFGQALFGFAMGAENANELGYRQAVTPDTMQSRVNTAMRSINRAMIVAGAPIGGLLADGLGHRPAMWIAIAGFALVPIFLVATPFRDARHGDGEIADAAS